MINRSASLVTALAILTLAGVRASGNPSYGQGHQPRQPPPSQQVPPEQGQSQVPPTYGGPPGGSPPSNYNVPQGSATLEYGRPPYGGPPAQPQQYPGQAPPGYSAPSGYQQAPAARGAGLGSWVADSVGGFFGGKKPYDYNYPQEQQYAQPPQWQQQQAPQQRPPPWQQQQPPPPPPFQQQWQRPPPPPPQQPWQQAPPPMPQQGTQQYQQQPPQGWSTPPPPPPPPVQNVDSPSAAEAEEMAADVPTFVELEDGSMLVTFRPKAFAAKKRQLMAGGASQLMAFVHFSSLVRFRRGPPRRVDGQPTEPVLATTPGWAQSAQAPPSPPAGALGRKTLAPLELVLTSSALSPSAVSRVRAAAAEAVEEAQPATDTSSSAPSSKNQSAVESLEVALSEALAGMPARELYAAVASRGETCAPLRPQADDLVRFLAQASVPAVLLAGQPGCLYDVAARLLLAQIRPGGPPEDLSLPPTLCLVAPARLELRADSSSSSGGGGNIVQRVECKPAAAASSVGSAIADLAGESSGAAGSLAQELETRPYAVLVTDDPGSAQQAKKGANGLKLVVQIGYLEPSEGSTAARLAEFEANGFDQVVLGDGGLGPVLSLMKEAATGNAQVLDSASRSRQMAAADAAARAEADRIQEAFAAGSF